MTTAMERLEETHGGEIAIAADMIYMSILAAWAGGIDKVRGLDRDEMRALAADFSERFRPIAKMLPPAAFAEFAITSDLRHRDMRGEAGLDLGDVMDTRRRAAQDGAPVAFLDRFDELAAELAAESIDL